MTIHTIKPMAIEPTPVELLHVRTEAELIRAVSLHDAPIVLNQPMVAKNLEKLALLFGGGIQETRTFGHVREIRNDPNNTLSIAESLARHEQHTDATFQEVTPPRFMLYFERTDPAGGGVSQFLPSSEILAHLDPDLVIALALGKVSYAREDHRGFTDHWTGPLLAHDDQGRWTFRWRYDERVRPVVVEDSHGRLEEAIEAVKALSDTLPKLEYAAVPGDLVVVPNRTWLHGRTQLSPNSDRLVLRAWVN
jgi:hypothetical protein